MLPYASAMLMSGSAASGPTDPHWANVVLLLGYNSPTGSGTFIDESSYAHTPSDVVSISPTDSVTYFGNTVGIGTGGSFLGYADADEFSFGSGDFTVETFMRFNQSTTGSMIVKWNGTTDHEWGFFVRPTLIEFYWSTTGADQTSVSFNPGASLLNFYHIAFSRVGNSGHLCFDGQIVAVANMAGVTIRNGAAKLGFGKNNNGTTAQWAGWLDETRITKGVGRYSGTSGSSYTVPTAAFPRS